MATSLNTIGEGNITIPIASYDGLPTELTPEQKQYYDQIQNMILGKGGSGAWVAQPSELSALGTPTGEVCDK
ncbi:MAG TPA: hypothetical protein VJB82_02645 [Candidatus Peribacterales bacterium]|nr:hypothetical protein [Candidatus Peribacterales bacterium]